MNSGKVSNTLMAIAVHIIFVLGGFLVLSIAQNYKDVFWQSVLVNIGSNLIVVTIIFGTFQFFRIGHFRDNNLNTSEPSHEKHRGLQESKKDERLNSLHSKNKPSITSNSSKVHRNANRRNLKRDR